MSDEPKSCCTEKQACDCNGDSCKKGCCTQKQCPGKGAIILAVGVMALLHTTGVVNPDVTKWWPVILIGVGAVALYQHFCGCKK